MAKKTKPKPEIEKVTIEVEMTPVESSRIKSVGHLPDKVHNNKRLLIIRFHKGGLYSYDGVDASVVQALLTSESAGKFFTSDIDGKYPFKKLE